MEFYDKRMASTTTTIGSNELKPITLSGGMRKDKKPRTIIKKSIPDTYKMTPIIEEVNSKLVRIDTGKFYEYANNMLEILIQNLGKTYFIEKDTYKEYRDQKKIWIMKHLLETRDGSIVVIEKCYEWINTTFHPQGIRLMNTFIEGINRDLQSKVRKAETSDENKIVEELEKFDRNRFNRGLEYLGLSIKEKISYRQIREEYELRKNLIGLDESGEKERDVLNEHFIYLRDFYSKYLEEILETPRS